MLTQDELKEYFEYKDGKLHRIKLFENDVNGKSMLGQPAGQLGERGYIRIKIRGKRYLEHRLVWLWHYGHMPGQELDHINGDKTDNRIENLRECTRSQNMQNRGIAVNNTSGFVGVSRDGSRWAANIKINGKQKKLGRFDTPEQASEAYKSAKAQLHTFQPTIRS